MRASIVFCGRSSISQCPVFGSVIDSALIATGFTRRPKASPLPSLLREIEPALAASFERTARSRSRLAGMKRNTPRLHACVPGGNMRHRILALAHQGNGIGEGGLGLDVPGGLS